MTMEYLGFGLFALALLGGAWYLTQLMNKSKEGRTAGGRLRRATGVD
jgi:hypothetical protein